MRRHQLLLCDSCLSLLIIEMTILSLSLGSTEKGTTTVGYNESEETQREGPWRADEGEDSDEVDPKNGALWREAISAVFSTNGPSKRKKRETTSGPYSEETQLQGSKKVDQKADDDDNMKGCGDDQVSGELKGGAMWVFEDAISRVFRTNRSLRRDEQKEKITTERGSSHYDEKKGENLWKNEERRSDDDDIGTTLWQRGAGMLRATDPNLSLENEERTEGGVIGYGRYGEKRTGSILLDTKGSPLKAEGLIIKGRTASKNVIISPYGGKPLVMDTAQTDYKTMVPPVVTLVLITTTPQVPSNGSSKIVLLEAPQVEIAPEPEEVDLVVPRVSKNLTSATKKPEDWYPNTVTPDVFPDYYHDPCKCSCLDTITYCKVPNTLQCLKSCNRRCRTGYDTLSFYGKCPSEGECNCFFTSEDKPFCVRRRGEIQAADFQNLRHVHCFNLCYDDEYEVVHEGICEGITQNELEDRKERKWIDENWKEDLNVSSFEYAYQERTTEESTEEPQPVFRYPQRMRYMPDRGREEAEYMEEERRVKEEEEMRREEHRARMQREYMGRPNPMYYEDVNYPEPMDADDQRQYGRPPDKRKAVAKFGSPEVGGYEPQYPTIMTKQQMGAAAGAEYREVEMTTKRRKRGRPPRTTPKF